MLSDWDVFGKHGLDLLVVPLNYNMFSCLQKLGLAGQEDGLVVAFAKNCAAGFKCLTFGILATT